MPFNDWPLEQLTVYRPPRTEPEDFDTFWAETLAAAREFPLEPQWVSINSDFALLDTFDVTFRGYGGAPIRGWLLLPKHRSGPLPCLVQYLGYGCGRGYIGEWIGWAAAGYATLVMDNRGQSAWWRGDTADPEPGTAPHFIGFMTQGILDPKTYFYRRLFTDAVRAIEAAQSHPAVDPTRIAVCGGSQGGGISLAAAALSPAVSVALIDVPFLCHYPVAAGMASTGPYTELAGYCRIQRDNVSTVFETLRYFDGVNFAARATAKALFSVGLMDETCPPRTVYAAYNHYAGEKQMRVYTFNNHEGGGARHDQERRAFLAKQWLPQ